MTCDYWGIMSPQPIFTARFRRLISLIPAERFLFPDLYGICHHHSYENRVWMWMAGEGSFPPAPQSGLASVSPTSSTWTQLTPHIPLPSLPPGSWDGTGTPLVWDSECNLTRLTTHTQTMDGSTYRAGPACAGSHRDTGGFGEKTQQSAVGRGKRDRDLPPDAPRPWPEP